MLAVVQAGELVGDPATLVAFVFGVVADDRLAGTLLGPEALGLAARVVVDHRVRSIEDRLARAVVLFQHHGGGLGKRVLELEDVADVGLAEPVDRLVGVADDTHVALGLGEQEHELVLDRVRVLVLVDQDVFEAALPGLQHIGMAAEHAHRVGEQIVEVHGAGGLEPLLVFDEDLRDLALVGLAGHVFVFLGGVALVLRRADRRVDRTSRVALGVDVQITQHIAGQPDGVGVVVDRERRRKADDLGFAAQDADAGRVECRDPHLLGDGTDQRFDALFHLVGGLVGEGDRQDRER